jgi:hypothetical protein
MERMKKIVEWQLHQVRKMRPGKAVMFHSLISNNICSQTKLMFDMIYI